jgi:hypothetical protein
MHVCITKSASPSGGQHWQGVPIPGGDKGLCRSGGQRHYAKQYRNDVPTGRRNRKTGSTSRTLRRTACLQTPLIRNNLNFKYDEVFVFGHMHVLHFSYAGKCTNHTPNI